MNSELKFLKRTYSQEEKNVPEDVCDTLAMMTSSEYKSLGKDYKPKDTSYMKTWSEREPDIKTLSTIFSEMKSQFEKPHSVISATKSQQFTLLEEKRKLCDDLYKTHRKLESKMNDCNSSRRYNTIKCKDNKTNRKKIKKIDGYNAHLRRKYHS